MATVTVTQASDPDLWQKLYDSYVRERYPRVVLDGTQMYESVKSTANEVFFVSVDSIDYIDSRSLTKSRKASYTELSG